MVYRKNDHTGRIVNQSAGSGVVRFFPRIPRNGVIEK